MSRLKFQKSVFLVLTVIVLGFPANALAVECPHGARDNKSPADFLSALTTSLELLKEARDLGIEASQSEISTDADLVLVLKANDSRYECALNMMSPFKDSPVGPIAGVSKKIEASIRVIRNHGSQTLEMFQSSLEGKKEPNIENEAEQTLAVKLAWESLATFYTEAKTLLKDSKREGRLVLKKHEIEHIKTRINKMLTEKKRVDKHPIEAAADGLSQFLNQKWQASDEEWIAGLP